MTLMRAFKHKLAILFRKHKHPTTPQVYTVPQSALVDSTSNSWIQISRPTSPTAERSPRSQTVNNQVPITASNAAKDVVSIVDLGEEHDSVDAFFADPPPILGRSTKNVATNLPSSAIPTAELPNSTPPSALETKSWTCINIQHEYTPHRALLLTPTLIFAIETTAHLQREVQTLAEQLDRAAQELANLKIAHGTLESRGDSVLVPGAFPGGDEHARREMLEWAIWRRIEVGEAAEARLRERHGEMVVELEAKRTQLVHGLGHAVQNQSD